jgi:hypothetical protein
MEAEIGDVNTVADTLGSSCQAGVAQSVDLFRPLGT